VTTLDEVIETVRATRKNGPDALAAMALSYGATMVLGSLRVATLREQLREAREDRSFMLCRLAVLMLTSPPGDGTITPEWVVEAARGLRREYDKARAERDAARLLARPRIGQPTRAEWDAHRATGGEWIRVSPGPNGGWDCGRALIHEPAAWLIPVRDGLPCVWPVAAEGGA
jgi:hypothetical protein